jgi:hypothetical protein
VKEMPDRDVEQKRLDLDRERLNFEQEKWRDELTFKKIEHGRALWLNPLVFAIFGAAVAGLLNVVVAYVNGSSQRELEKSKSEALLVLEMIKTADPDKAAANLAFLADTGLLSDKDQVERIHNYLKQRTPGQGPSLPPLGRVTSHFFSDFSNNERTFDYSTNDGKITVSAGGHAFVLRFSKGDNTSIYLYKDGTNLVRIARVKSSQQTDYDTSSRVSAIKLGEAFLAENTEGAILAGRIIDLKDDSRGDDHDEVRFTYELSRDRK